MNKKHVWAVALYLVAIVLPTGAVAARYGFSAPVALGDSSAALEQVFTMVGALTSGMLLALFAGRLLSDESENLMSFALKTIEQISRRDAHSS